MWLLRRQTERQFRAEDFYTNLHDDVADISRKKAMESAKSLAHTQSAGLLNNTSAAVSGCWRRGIFRPKPAGQLLTWNCSDRNHVY